MSEAHGVNIGKVKVTITGTGDGLTVYVKPLTLPLRRALTLQSEKLYPYPDKKLYERSRAALGALPSFDGNDTLPAEDNPAYRAACLEVDKQRLLWLNDAAIEACVMCDSKALLIKAFEGELEALKSIGLDSYRVMPWANILYHFLCAETRDGVSEWWVLIQTVNGNMPLTEGETRDGMTFFRLDLQRYVARHLARQSRSPSAASNEQGSLFNADGRDDRREELGTDVRPDDDSEHGELVGTAERDAGAADRALPIGTFDKGRD